MVNVELRPEPSLIFSNNKKCVDPKVGLLAYGPNGIDSEHRKGQIVRAGVIATHSTLISLKNFLDELQRIIPVTSGRRSRSEPWKREFPGLGVKGILGFEIVIDPSATETISVDEEMKALEPNNRKEKIVNAVALYDQKFEDLASSSHPGPDLVFVPLSQRLVQACKDPAMKTDRIVYQKRTMDTTAPRENFPLFDFHHVLKVIAFQRNLACQVVLPSTLDFDKSLQDKATIAWNFTVAAYYKGTGTPWKLADLDDRTCLVGISFFQEMSEDGSAMNASMAHVYVRTGESQIIRGKPFRWENKGKRWREPSLDSENAEKILRDVVDLFHRQRDSKPSRIVVHKTSPFTRDERVGFDRAVEGVPKADYIHIEAGSGIRFYHDRLGYPPVRGTLITSSTANSPVILYTVGFVPALDTYQGSTAPFPLTLRIERSDTNARQMADDILCLSKMDWNSADFCRRTPVTTSVSSKVGSILAEMRARDLSPPNPYKHYM